MKFDDVIAKAARNGRDLEDSELKFLLNLERAEELKQLYQTAYQIKLAQVGNLVRLRGLIEISNVCTKDCFYCGIRKSNTQVKRFTMTMDEIIEAAKLALEFDYGSVVIQGGERDDQIFTSFITEAIQKIKQLSKGQLGITLSLGEQSRQTLQEWFAAGAHRYLLRIEASNPKLYQKLHPADHSYQERLECLARLRQVGFQVGTGVMIGLPMQTLDDLIADLKFFRSMDVDMIGMGPYLVHHETPLGQQYPEHGSDQRKTLELGLKMIAVTRIYLQNVNIASTTALQTLAADGRERGLLAGANVIMPNIGSLNYRHNYLLYENKPGLDENAVESRQKLEQSVAKIGEKIAYGQWGDSPHFKARLHSD